MNPNCKPGDRIRLLSMPDDPDPLPAGSLGTVQRVTDIQIAVRWDNSGRSLMLCPDADRFEVLPMPVRVPREVLRGIEAVRVSGATNMLSRPDVIRLARKMGHREAAAWLADPANQGTYAEGIFRGFAADDDDAEEAPAGRPPR
jgi:hypothetical protein